MVGYVESNFVLELALGQEGHEDAQALLAAARAGLELVIPVFCLCEPYGTVVVRARKRGRVFREVQEHLRDLRRSDDHQGLVDALSPRVEHVLDVDKLEMDGVERVVGELLGVATILPFTGSVLASSVDFQSQHGLQAPDAVVYAAVVENARGRARDEPKFFVTRNSKDFDVPTIRDELLAQGCQLFTSFGAARAYATP